MSYPHFSVDCHEYHAVVVDTGPIVNIAVERDRQDAKWGEQNHPDGTGGSAARELAVMLRRICQNAPTTAEGDTWAKILAEEVGEAFAETDVALLREELIQVAAVAVNWVEAIDRRVAAEAGDPR